MIVVNLDASIVVALPIDLGSGQDSCGRGVRWGSDGERKAGKFIVVGQGESVRRGCYFPVGGRFRPFPVPRGSFTPPGKREGQLFLVFRPLFTHEIRALLTSPIVRAFRHRSRLGLSVDSTFRLRSASLALPTT